MSDNAPLPLDRWCTSGPVRVSRHGSLEVVLRGADPVEVSLIAAAPDEAALVATWSAPWWLAQRTNAGSPALEEMARATAAQRSALLDCIIVGAEVQLRLPLYLEGMSRHTFLEAACDVARARIALAAAAAALGDADDEPDRVARTMAEANATAAANARSRSDRPAESAPAASFGATPSNNQPNPMPSAVGVNDPMPIAPAASANQPAPMTTGANAYAPAASWQPSHLVPPEGLPAWETPDGRTAPAAQLWGGLPVQVVEHWNGWARIVCSNEWTAWVDAARLQSRHGRA